MTTIPLESAEQMRAHTRQQAKRLRERLKISLTVARNILAQEVYRCKDWHELKGRIDAGANHEACLVLASPSSEGFQAILQSRELELARAIGGRVLANANLAGMLETVRYVFTQRQQTTSLEDIATRLHTSAWLPAGIGPDAYAVIEAFANINGQPIKLIGTRVYLPNYMRLPEHLRGNASLATPHGQPVAIMWSDPKTWFDTACAYLDGLDDDLDEWPEFAIPRLRLDRLMKRHAKWFDSLMRYWSREGCYGDEDNMFHPFVTARGTYLVFGLPSAQHGTVPPAVTTIECGGDNTGTLAHLDGQAVRIESFTIDPESGTHLGDFAEHVEAVKGALFQHADYCSLQADRVYFVVPAADFDISDALTLDMSAAPGQEVFAIKTDRIDLLEDLLAAICRREVVWFDSPSGMRRYFTTLRVPDNGFNGFSLNLELSGETNWHSIHLVLTTLWKHENGHCVAYLELQPRFLALFDALGGKAIMDAARDGLVLSRPAGFGDSLDKAGLWRSGLSAAPVALRKAFDYRRRPGVKSIPEMLVNMRRTVYRRDHF